MVYTRCLKKSLYMFEKKYKEAKNTQKNGFCLSKNLVLTSGSIINCSHQVTQKLECLNNKKTRSLEIS